MRQAADDIGADTSSDHPTRPRGFLSRRWVHMYIGLGTLIFILVIVAIIYFVRRA
jgi:hypothetical protein